MIIWIIIGVIFGGSIVISINLKEGLIVLFGIIMSLLFLAIFFEIDRNRYDTEVTESIEVYLNEVPPAEGRHVRIIDEPGAESGYIFRYYIDGTSSDIRSSNLTPSHGISEVVAVRTIRTAERNLWSMGWGSKDEITVFLPIKINN